MAPQETAPPQRTFDFKALDTAHVNGSLETLVHDEHTTSDVEHINEILIDGGGLWYICKHESPA